MTTPILAVNALNSFVAAYNSWEWAFLVCQEESNWTLAVWMYQMSQQLADQPWAVLTVDKLLFATSKRLSGIVMMPDGSIYSETMSVE